MKITKIKGGVFKMWWWFLIPVLIFAVVGLIAYVSGKELKEDIRKGGKKVKYKTNVRDY
ncbi:hypothetical protein ES708_23073 [subsurface metagenome]